MVRTEWDHFHKSQGLARGKPSIYGRCRHFLGQAQQCSERAAQRAPSPWAFSRWGFSGPLGLCQKLWALPARPGRFLRIHTGLRGGWPRGEVLLQVVRRWMNPPASVASGEAGGREWGGHVAQGLRARPRGQRGRVPGCPSPGGGPAPRPHSPGGGPAVMRPQALDGVRLCPEPFPHLGGRWSCSVRVSVASQTGAVTLGSGQAGAARPWWSHGGRGAGKLSAPSGGAGGWLDDSCLLSSVTIACWAAWFLLDQLHIYCLLSCVIPACSASWLLHAELRDFCLLSSIFIACWAVWFLLAHLHDYCLLSCVIPACSSPWLLPAELRDSCLLISMIIACWAAWFLPAQLFDYCMLSFVIPTPVFLPGESQGRGSLVGCHLWGRTELDMTEAT